MPLYIYHSDNEKSKVCEAGWVIPATLPVVRPIKVVELRADGVELDKVLELFDGLLYKEHRTYTVWEGSLAKLVYERVLSKLGPSSVKG